MREVLVARAAIRMISLLIICSLVVLCTAPCGDGVNLPHHTHRGQEGKYRTMKISCTPIPDSGIPNSEFRMAYGKSGIPHHEVRGPRGAHEPGVTGWDIGCPGGDPGHLVLNPKLRLWAKEGRGGQVTSDKEGRDGLLMRQAASGLCPRKEGSGKRVSTPSRQKKTPQG